MKKMFSVLLITTIITTLGSPVYASSQNPSDLQECIESSMFYNNEYRLFNEFTYQGMEINLFPETTITKEESKLLTQHSIDRSEFLPTGDYFSLANLYSQDYKIYGYEMDKAPIK